MKDPALGRDKSERALGEYAPKRGVRAGKTRSAAFGYTDTRFDSPGIYAGPRGQYQRYSASPAASDVAKKTQRGKGTQ